MKSPLAPLTLSEAINNADKYRYTGIRVTASDSRHAAEEQPVNTRMDKIVLLH